LPKPDVSELRNKQIIAAAIAVFSEKGFHQARMEDISRAAGLSKGTLYLYFKNKDALIKAIASKVFHRELAELEIARPLPGTTAEKLHSLVEYVAAEDEAAILLPIVYEFRARFNHTSAPPMQSSKRMIASMFLNLRWAAPKA